MRSSRQNQIHFINKHTGAWPGIAPALAEEVDQARCAAAVSVRGYIRAIATCEREPVKKSIVRALVNGAESYWGGKGRKPVVLGEARALLDAPDPSASDIVKLFGSLEEHAPVLLALDEFGKAIEFAAEDMAHGDLFVMQLLAERVNISLGASCILTLQHLALADYAQALPTTAREEWLKVQGRFQDIPFLSSSDESIAFIRGHFAHEPWPGPFDARIDAWAKSLAPETWSLDMSQFRSTALDAIDYYPLSPLTLALAPTIAHDYAQGDRSLHTWLSGDEPHSFYRFIHEHTVDEGDLPVYGPDRLFDYFLGPESQTLASRADSRSLEVLGRIKDATGLSPLEHFLLRTVGLLNLAGSGEGLYASRGLLGFAAQAQGFGEASAVDSALANLAGMGFLTYRSYAHEYRIWQGSDIDVEDRLARIREHLGGLDVHDELNRLTPPAARVAQRHGHQTGTFRYFRTLYGSSLPEYVLASAADQADGLLVYTLEDGSRSWVPDPVLEDGRPVVVCKSPDLPAVKRALEEVVALDSLADCEDVKNDAVARREVRERLATSVELLGAALRVAFDASRADLSWFRMGRRVTLTGPRDVSALLSDVCDEVFHSGLWLRNELLNRVQLTSQGAKARRVLLGQMVACADSEAFGIEGYGPERSMYESLFRAMGLHAKTAGRWVLRAPQKASPARSVWSAIDDFTLGSQAERRTLDQLLGVLACPPYGVRESVSIVLVLAYLVVKHEDVAVYQDGTFEPEISDPMVERLLKAPDRFAVRLVSGKGIRALVTAALVSKFGPSRLAPLMRNAGLLSAVRPSFAVVQRLNDYARYTTRLSAPARAVRSAVLSGREIDELLFVDLPTAVGLSPFGYGDSANAEAATAFADRLADTLGELSSAYDQLLFELEDEIVAAFRVPPDADVRLHLRERVRRVKGRVLDNRLRNLILYAMDETLPKREWLEALCMTLSEKPPSSWRDSDLEVFLARLREAAALFARVEHLHAAVTATEHAEGFTARRVAVTMPDGDELHRVVWIDDSDAQSLRTQILEFIHALPHGDSPRTMEAVLAVLADEVLNDTDHKLTAQSPSALAVNTDDRNFG